MSEDKKAGWNERRFFSLNLNPKDAMPEDNPSTLPNLETNPARYPEPELGEAPTTPKDKETPFAEGALPAPGGSGTNPPPSTPYPGGDRPPNPADPTKPPVGPEVVPTPGAPTVPTPEAALREDIPAVEKTTPDA